MQIRKEKRKEKVLNLETEIFNRSKLLGEYIVKILFEWTSEKFKDEYLKNLKKI